VHKIVLQQFPNANCGGTWPNLVLFVENWLDKQISKVVAVAVVVAAAAAAAAVKVVNR